MYAHHPAFSSQFYHSESQLLYFVARVFYSFGKILICLVTVESHAERNTGATDYILLFCILKKLVYVSVLTELMRGVKIDVQLPEYPISAILQKYSYGSPPSRDMNENISV